MKRSGPLPRSTPLKRGKPLRKRSPKTGGHRFPGYVLEDFREFVRGLPCAACGRGPSQPHHVRTRGAGGADAANLAPLCYVCHTELHTVGRRTFAERFAVDLAALAGRTWDAYQLAAPTPQEGAR